MIESGTFALIPIEVIKDKRLTLEQTRVLIALFSFRGEETNVVWPSREAIAERTGMSLARISEATTALAKLGWLKKSGSGGRSMATRYTITVPQQGTVTEQGTVPQQGTKRCPNGELNGALTGNGQRTYQEHTKNIPVEVASATARAQDKARLAVTQSSPGRQATTKPKQDSGSRLPADWVLPMEWAEWALREQPTWTEDHVRKVAACFRDYWVAKAGSSARKLDWGATWRNWVRREKPLSQTTPIRAPGEKFDPVSFVNKNRISRRRYAQQGEIIDVQHEPLA